MEKKQVKGFKYVGLGFPIMLIDIPFVRFRNIWTPAIDYNKLQQNVLWGLTRLCTFLARAASVHLLSETFI
jgi:hypothetical protein